MPRHRVFGNVVLSFMTKVASGYWNLFDPQNGYTAIRQDASRGCSSTACRSATSSRTTC